MSHTNNSSNGSSTTTTTTTRTLLAPPQILGNDLLTDLTHANQNTKTKFDAVLRIPWLNLVKIDEGTIYPIITKAFKSYGDMYIMNVAQLRRINTYAISLLSVLPVVAQQQLSVQQLVQATGSLAKKNSEESQRELDNYMAFCAKFSGDIDTLKNSLNKINQNITQLKQELEQQQTSGTILDAIKRALGSVFSFSSDSSVGDLLNISSEHLTSSVNQTSPDVMRTVIQKLNRLIEVNTETREKASELVDSLQLNLDLSSKLTKTWPQIVSDYEKLANDASLFPTNQVNELVQDWTRVKNEAEAYILDHSTA